MRYYLSAFIGALLMGIGLPLAEAQAGDRHGRHGHGGYHHGKPQYGHGYGHGHGHGRGKYYGGYRHDHRTYHVPPRRHVYYDYRPYYYKPYHPPRHYRSSHGTISFSW